MMKIKTIMALAIICILLISSAAVAVKPADKGKNKATGFDTLEADTENGDDDGTDDTEENETDDDEDEDENETDEANGKIKQGPLISATQAARREEWKATKEELKAAGYHGPVNLFATSYNSYTKTMKDEIREKIAVGNNTNMTARVINTVARRDLARLRTRIMAHLNITLDDAQDAVDDLLEGEADDETLDTLEDEMEDMEPEMLGALYGIAEEVAEEESTEETTEEEEREELIENLLEYAEEVELGEVPIVEVDETEVDDVMEQLENGASVEEILEVIE